LVGRTAFRETMPHRWCVWMRVAKSDLRGSYARLGSSIAGGVPSSAALETGSRPRLKSSSSLGSNAVISTSDSDTGDDGPECRLSWPTFVRHGSQGWSWVLLCNIHWCLSAMVRVNRRERIGTARQDLRLIVRAWVGREGNEPKFSSQIRLG